MTRNFVVAALIFLSLTAAHAQTGRLFPTLTGKTIAGQTLTLPDDTGGKYTLVGVAYSQKSQDDLEGWFAPVYQTFLSKEKSMWETSGAYDVNVYFVPMLGGIKGAAAGQVEQKMQKKLDKELQPHVLLYAGPIKAYKEQLELGRKDEPYFFVLDPAGKIVYATQGAYSDRKMAEVEAHLGE